MKNGLLVFIIYIFWKNISFSSTFEDIKFGGEFQLNYGLAKKEEKKLDGKLTLGAAVDRFSLLTTVNLERENITTEKPSLSYPALQIQTKKVTFGLGRVGISSDYYSSSGDGIYARMKDGTSISYNYEEKTSYISTNFSFKKYSLSLHPAFFKTKKYSYFEISSSFSPAKYLNFDTSCTTYTGQLYYKIHPIYSKDRYYISYKLMRTPFLTQSIDIDPIPTKTKEIYVRYNTSNNINGGNIIYQNKKTKNYNTYSRYGSIGFSQPIKKISLDLSYSSFKTKDNIIPKTTETNTTQLRLRQMQKKQPIVLTYTHKDISQTHFERKIEEKINKLSLSKLLELYPNGATCSFGISRTLAKKRTTDDGYVYVFYPLDGKASLTEKFLTLEYFTSTSQDEFDERNIYEGITLRYTQYFGDDIYQLVEPRKTSIKGVVFLDKNANGKKDKGERGIKDVHIELNRMFDAKTNRKGKFKFEDIEAKDAEITINTETLPAGWRAKEDTVKVKLRPNKKTVVYIPVILAGSAKGYVFEDKNDNDILDEDDAPVKDIRITIDEVSDWTNGDGEYIITNILPGKYKVLVDKDTLPLYYEVKTKEMEIDIIPSKEVIIPPFLLKKVDYILPPEEEEIPLPTILMPTPTPVPVYTGELPQGPLFGKEMTLYEIEKKFKERGVSLFPLRRKFIIYFDEGETKTLSLAMKNLLDECIASALSYPEYVVYIEGHSDMYEDDKEMFGLERAKAISNYMINTGKLSPENVYFRGVEKAKPLATSETPEGRARNRRVEITIYLPK